MKSYSLKCRKDTENINSKFQTLVMVEQWCYQNVQYGSKKLKFIKNQQAKGQLSNLGVRTPSSKVPILGNILF